jgi:hypothetical protein
MGVFGSVYGQFLTARYLACSAAAALGKSTRLLSENVVVIGAARPLRNVRPDVASDRSVILLGTRDSIITFIEAKWALRSVSEIVRLDGVSVAP